ncbi:hypothetical protein RFI_15994 [Reticulomyxa filosa]|uniref:Protease Do-like PDZ domain-containing protein n=1 Tax=Reticulomyxa filosa TaxID=46433 RepID=X6N4J0_RETFI|nr:hypothetical protein RFI_15994 [Reticulomyxa filosa]|eukprot:ETO21210.1 hypothetical protein RFI_15994 [Reticulomyxa filosa]
MPRGENIGFIIPTPVIDHFLGDINKFGTYKGFCRLGANYQPLTDTYCVHEFFGMDKHTRKPPLGGILITKIHEHTPASGKLQPYDIVTQIDGRDVSNDGMTKFQDDGCVAMEHWITEKFEDDVLPLQVFRQGKFQSIEVQMKVCELVVPVHRFEKHSSYYIFGGCVFIPLTQPYLHTWGETWYQDAPRDLLSAAFKGDIADPLNVSELVIVSTVLPHTINMGCSLSVCLFGDVEIRSLSHLKQVLESHVLNGDKLIDFYFKEGAMMVLPVQQNNRQIYFYTTRIVPFCLFKKYFAHFFFFFLMNRPEFEQKLNDIYEQFFKREESDKKPTLQPLADAE